MPGPGVICVGIDLDDLRYYRAIHALPQVDETPIVFDTAVPRFLDLCEGLGLRATLFTISEDLRWPEARTALRDAVRRGHEIASHSMTHPYNLSRRPQEDIRREVVGSKAALEDSLGTAVVGFRAPGYNLTPALLHVLAAGGYRYDASILPSPPYWMARAAVLAAMRLSGKRSASISGRARDFMRSRVPFSWQGAGQGLREYPITACGPGRLPLIGTALAGSGWIPRLLLRSARTLPFVHVEFHALDFLDLSGDYLEPAMAIEPALRVALKDRMARYNRVLEVLSEGRNNAPLAEM
jgi:hypothetical protein